MRWWVLFFVVKSKKHLPHERFRFQARCIRCADLDEVSCQLICDSILPGVLEAEPCILRHLPQDHDGHIF